MTESPSSAPPIEDVPLSRRAAVGGMGWITAGSILRYALSAITTLVLVRLLDPDDIGLMAVTVIAQTLIGQIASVGFHDALIQRPTLNQGDLSTAFWSIGVVAGLFALLVMLAAFPVAALYDEPRLGPLLIVVALVSLLRAPAAPARALLARRLDFRTPTLARLVASVLAGMCAVILALAGAGLWSLVAHLAIFNGTVTLWVLRATGWRPSRTIARPTLRALWIFAPSVIIHTITSYIVMHADDQLIAYRLGAESLGYYTLAYTVMAWPVFDLLGGVTAVLYPVLSRLQDNLPRLHAAYLEAMQIVTLLAFPFLTLVVVIAPVALPWLLGEKWKPAVVAVQILAIGGLREAPMVLTWAAYRARGRPDIQMLLGMVSLVCYLLAYVIGLEWGIEGVAFFFVLTSLLLFPVSLWLLLRVLQMPLLAWLRALVPAALGTLVMAPVAVLTLRMMHPGRAALPALVVTLAAALFAYGAAMILCRPAPLRRAWRAVYPLLSRRFPSA